MSLQNEIVRIEQAQRDVRAFIEEQRRSRKSDRFVWLFLASGMIPGAAIFAAGMAFGKII